MERTALVIEAKAAGAAARHNLRLIRKQPEKMLPGKAKEAEAHLNIMIYFLEMEMKNDRRSGQSRLRTHLKSLVVSILNPERSKRKGGEHYV